MDIRTRNALYVFRQRRGISASKLAAQIGVSRQTIYAIEAGKYVPNTVVALLLASILQTSVEELFWIEVSGASQRLASSTAAVDARLTPPKRDGRRRRISAS